MFIIFTSDIEEDRNRKIEYLIKKLADGDIDSLDELYLLIKDDIHAYALSKLLNAADAEDVLHDTFVKIYRYSSKYISYGKPMAWVITIASNIIKRHKELKMRHVSYDEAIVDTQYYESNFELETINNEFLRSLLKTLDESEREIVVLHAVSGFKHREIAEFMNKPLSTVLSKYNRAIKKLQAIAKEE